MPLMAVATRVAPTHGGVPITVGGRYRSCPCLRDTLNDVAVAPAAAARSAAIKAHVTLLAAVQCMQRSGGGEKGPAQRLKGGVGKTIPG